MSFPNAVTSIRILAQRSRSTVWLVAYQGGLAVLKEYAEDAADTYAREVRNVASVRRAGFTDLPVMLGHDETQRAILSEYFPDGDVWTLLLSCREEREHLIHRVLDAMEREAALLGDSALAALSGIGPDPYTCIQRLAQRAAAGDERFAPLLPLAREAQTLPGPFLCTRYDPELTNYLLAPGGTVCASDFASVRCCHPFYLPTYALVHIALAWQRTRNPEARVILGAFVRAARSRCARDGVTRRLWLLNLAEVFAYLIDWAIRKAKPVDAWQLRGVLATGRKLVALASA